MKPNAPFTPAVCMTLGTSAAYLVLYNGYHNGDNNRTIDLKREYTKFFKSGYKYQLNQLNKVALSVLGMGLLVSAKEARGGLIKCAAYVYGIHSAYSAWQCWAKLALNETPVEKPVTMALGLLAGAATYFFSLPENVNTRCPLPAALAVGLATTHFWMTTKTDKKTGKLIMHPCGFMALMSGLVAGGKLVKDAIAC